MEKTNFNPQGVILGSSLGGHSMECYARKLGVLGETIDEDLLQRLRRRLAHLLVVDGNEVFELFAAQGKESNAFFGNPSAFPYFVRVDKAEPNNPDSRLRIAAVLKGPLFKASIRPRGGR
ncbi:hypothetical protein HZA44_02750 [Candidatus Peregrinibacteria bacterium]|nr:hypothetical protein [Candidatus Peregrinibacteria bacterium]